MDGYIGLDAHVSSCTLGVIGPSGKRLGHRVVETNAQALVAAVSEGRGAKNDKLDAFARAEQLRIGAIKTKVDKGQGRFGRLRHLARGHGIGATG